MGKNKGVIYTIGHSNRSIEEFLALLKKWKITMVVDVRRFPTSKHPQFKKAYLAGALRDSGIKYLWLGDLLGGFRRGGYREYMKSKDFNQGIKLLEQLAQKERIAIMCAEKFWFKCHRRFIAQALKEKGWVVEHIIE